MQLLLLALAGASSIQQAAGENPIRRIVTLLQNMQQEIEHEQVEAKQMYEKFMCYCDNNLGQAKSETEDSTALIASLESTIKELTGSNAQIDSELAELAEELSENKKSLEEQKGTRQKEASAFAAESTETKNNIAALDKAIPKLEAGLDFAQQTALLQQLKQLSFLKPEHGKNLQALVQTVSNEQAALGSGDTQGRSSDMILGVLHQMRDDFKASLEDMIKDEQDAIKRYEQLEGSKSAEIKAAQEETDKLTGEQSTNAEALAEAKSEYEKITRALEKAQNRLIDLKQQCEDRSKEFDLATKGRQQELKAIGQAVKILNDDSALDLFKKTVPQAPEAKPALLSKQAKLDPAAQAWAAVEQPAQRAPSTASSDEDPAADVWKLLTRKAAPQPQQQDLLAEITGPTFVQAKPAMQPVIKLVSNMGSQLKKDQGDDDDQKAFCESEIEKTDDSSKETENKANMLEQEIATLGNNKESLQGKIKENVACVDKQDTMVKEAGETRKEENAKFLQVSSDQTTAIALIEKAKQVLGSAYGPQSLVQETKKNKEVEHMLGLSFVQMKESEQDLDEMLLQVGEAAEQPTDRTKQGAGIMALMDEMKHDVEVELAELKKDEASAQADYQKLVQASAEERKAKMVERTGLSEALAKVDEKMDIRKGALKGYKEEIKSLADKLSALHDQCDFLLNNYDVRKKARGQEIDGLARSEAVLSGADFDSFAQRRLRG